MAMSWTLYRHAKGMHYLGLGRALHSESKESHEVYRCLYDNDLAKTWIRPSVMFDGLNDSGVRRFEPIGRVRIVEPEDEATVLAFGYDAWGAGRSLPDFVASYARDRNHLRGTRYLLESRAGEIVANLNVLRFARGRMGIASVATAVKHRGNGYARLLLRAVMELKRLECGDEIRFMLFSEVAPRIYEDCGFRLIDDEHQHFRPSLAMVTGREPLSADEAETLKTYF